MECPKCNSDQIRKDGVVNEKQRYLCKKCYYHFTVLERGMPKEIKRQAIELYLEGLGFRSIERILKVSNVSIMKWVKKLGIELDNIRRRDKPEIVEMDEMHTYVEGKKTTVGSGLLLIDIGKDSSALLLGQEKLKLD
jgi:transposase-like protein